jgi:monofunctional biosynthetic peptidoglycan transglycosylase
MATRRAANTAANTRFGRLISGAGRWSRRALLGVLIFWAVAVLAYAVIAPPTTPYIVSEGVRLGGVQRQWVPMDRISPAMARAAVAAEDANFCLHWGFDMGAIRAALADGAVRGASTISQQTVKNVYLWQGRSWPRKALEAVLTPAVEAVWSKRRILEVYLNVAEFGEGVFGVEAAARRYFGIAAADLDADRAARLTVLLPDPKGRSPLRLSPALGRRAAAIRDGAATIRADGRAACFDS